MALRREQQRLVAATARLGQRRQPFGSMAPAYEYEQALKIKKEKLNPALTPYYRKPLYAVRALNQHIWDNEGRQYLDFFGGIVTVSVGHCNPEVNRRLKEQLDKLWHTTSIYVTEPQLQYAEQLTAKLPKSLSVCYFVNSGSEANDLALLMARLHTRKFDVLTMRHGYHGLTQTLQGATNLSTWKMPIPAGFGIQKVINADPYRGPWGGKNCRDCVVPSDRSCECAPGQCQASNMYAEQLRDTIMTDIPNDGPAALLIESIQGVGGTIQFPRGFVKKAFEHVRAKGGVCISDEVQTGFGRLGDKFWGFETHDVVPDIVTMAKGIGNGFPLAAVVTTPDVAKSLGKALHFNTYGGNPMASTVGMAVLDEIDKHKMQENCKTLGEYFITELGKLRAQSQIIGDVRGKGLMIGVELVSDKTVRTPLPSDKMADIFEQIKDAGLLVGKGGLYGNTLRIKPPMSITRQDVDQALEILSKVLLGYKL